MQMSEYDNIIVYFFTRDCGEVEVRDMREFNETSTLEYQYEDST